MGALSFALIADFENGNQHGVYNALLVAVKRHNMEILRCRHRQIPLQRNKRSTQAQKQWVQTMNSSTTRHKPNASWQLRIPMELKQTMVTQAELAQQQT